MSTTKKVVIFWLIVGGAVALIIGIYLLLGHINDYLNANQYNKYQYRVDIFSDHAPFLLIGVALIGTSIYLKKKS